MPAAVSKSREVGVAQGALTWNLGHDVGRDIDVGPEGSQVARVHGTHAL